jgi:hypothetical protein
MTPSIDRNPYARKRMAASYGSPPPAKIVTEEQIIQRGCPGAPRKTESISRKRVRQRSPNTYIVMNMMGEDVDDDDDDGREEPVRMLPRHMFPPSSPTHVQDVPRPTPRRALPSGGHLTSHILRGEITPTASNMRK